VSHIIHTLVAGVVDYAGLFPPAKLDMGDAVRAYADYSRDPNRFMLGRFVVPVSRLPELEEAAVALFPGDDDDAVIPWRLAALTGADVEADIALALAFNDRHARGAGAGRAEIDTLEIKASSTAEIASAMSRMPSAFRPFFEIPIASDPNELLGELRRCGGAAKVRTGGVTPDAFPATADVVRFIRRCTEQRVAFKATAGLHHPVRAVYRLTYDEQPPMGTMYGYLNILVATACARHGAPDTMLEAILEETDPHAFVVDDTGISYHGVQLSMDDVSDTRTRGMISFGSCSFREPVDDLTALGLLSPADASLASDSSAHR
jgi:hypothetical protein